MIVVVSGATGFIGSQVVASLKSSGHTVKVLTRKKQPDAITWNPEKGVLDAKAIEGADAIIHLAGESVADRWTTDKKHHILYSRINGTGLLAKAAASCEKKPSVFITASAIGFYGERGNEFLSEESPQGKGFLPKVCSEWEIAAAPAEEAGIRTAKLRIGVVLGHGGGVLGRMLPPFKMGMGGKLGTGEQWMSWVHIADIVAAINFILDNDKVSGVFNLVAPNPVTNEEFTHLLGKTLSRPAVVPMPVSVAHLAFGQEMADELLLSSSRVLPTKLTESGYSFHFPHLEAAFKDLLKN